VLALGGLAGGLQSGQVLLNERRARLAIIETLQGGFQPDWIRAAYSEPGAGYKPRGLKGARFVHTYRMQDMASR